MTRRQAAFHAMGLTLHEYQRLTLLYAHMVAQNYYLTQADLFPGSPPYALTREQSEAVGLEQHKVHVRLYEARERVLGRWKP